MWIYVDNDNLVYGYNPNNMAGNTGWVETSADIPEVLYDNRGIPLYRHDLNTDTIIQRTQEEMDADYIPPVTVPDPTERIAALEAAMTAIEEGIASV